MLKGAWRRSALLCAVLAMPAPVLAQTTTAPAARPAAELERNFLKNLLRDQKAIWTSPAQVRTNDIWWLGSLAGATAAFIATDRQTGDAMAEQHPDWVDPSAAISHAGAAYAVYPAAAAFYLIGRAAKNDRLTETGLLAGEALINSAIVTGVVKGITQRARPGSGDERGHFFVGGSSFPSGHASNIWSVATVVASEYHDRKIVPVVAYTAAALVSMSRFTGQRHYLSDVLVGSAIGFGVGRYVYRVHHLDAVQGTGASGMPASRTGANRWPLISPQVDRHTQRYSIGLTWIY